MLRLLSFRKRTKLTTVLKTETTLSAPSCKKLATWRDQEGENDLPSSEKKMDTSPIELPESFDLMTIKVGAVTYALDVFSIVYLEVYDDTTTVYLNDDSHVEVKIPLSRLLDRLPKSRFVKVHDSRAIAVPYFLRETGGHVYMRCYEDKGLKLGRADRFPEYKEWKERNRLK
ncbi:LytTR family DNA-binding domain-containing protein [Sphingobacterium gobiense]|nr:LytTR family DNA-binding domain-containing protein [Sphingobacterium gobiense]